jgi:hypothetical protein
MVKHWMQKATAKMKEKGTEGSLTSAAHHAGYDSALAFAHHIKGNPDATTKMKRKANFAINANKGK